MKNVVSTPSPDDLANLLIFIRKNSPNDFKYIVNCVLDATTTILSTITEMPYETSQK